MNKLAILSVVAAVAAVVFVSYSPVQSPTLESEFYTYMAEFGKSYTSEAEVEYRMQVFKQNMKQAKALNELNPDAEFGATIFSDLTDEEMLRRMGDLDMEVDTAIEHFFETAEPNGDINWISKFSPIQNQGSCGSCWAFAATANFEAWNNIIGKGLTKFSEQELVDCVTTCSGCNGGLANLAYDWLASNQFCTLESYPYLAKGGSCHSSTCKTEVTDKGHGMVSTGEAGILKKLSEGPVSVSIDATVWKNYKGGILSEGCTMNTNHAVVVAAFNDQGADSYWTIRNSWGTGWGEQGYIRVHYGTNMCNIERRPSYPVFR